MIQRKALDFLYQWKEKANRKPLILRGARQVGKSTLVEEFSKQFPIYLKLNLEKPQDKAIFDQYDDIDSLLSAIYMHNKKNIEDLPTLLFIDEIQFSTKAIALLRYFYEEASHIYIIAAGSLLESLLNIEQISFPVGRVEYYPIRPCNFIEFLDGIGEEFDKNLILNLNADPVHDRIMSLFRSYTLVGGMPEAIVEYSKKRDILAVKNVYESLLTSYIDDSEKYAENNIITTVIRHCLSVGWSSAAEAITFEGFGGSNFKSREVGTALKALQKAFILELIYPISNTQLPIIQNFRKKPKLLWLDTGLVNFASKIQHDVFSVIDIQDVYRGRIAEHIVGQELLCLDDSVLANRSFWRRDKAGSDAEIDFVYIYKGNILPIEVKSGNNSKLKSLHMFMDSSLGSVAIRTWAGKLSIDKVTTRNGKEFKLINVPYYYICVLDKLLDSII